MKRALTALAVAAATLAVAASAHDRAAAVASVVTATDVAVDLDAVAEDLRTDAVYVDADAEEALSPDEADDVRAAIRQAGTPIYVAVLPASAADGAGGATDEVLTQLAEAVGRRGTYAVVVGDQFRAGSTVLAAGQAGELATASFDASADDGVAAVLVDFAQTIGEAAAGEGSATGSGSGEAATSASDDDGGTSWVLPVLLVGGAGAVGAWAWRSGKRRRAEQAERQREEEADRQLLRAELSVLADDIVRLETEVQLHPDAQGDFDAAVNRYRAAQAAIEHADEAVDLVRVERVVIEARYSMDRTKAIIAGREPPAPPAELQQPGRHGEPALTLDEERQPAYVGYPGGYGGGGWFGGANGLFTGLLLGSMMGGWGFGGTTIINNDGGGDGGDGGGFGDFGGGGGGDFGGGFGGGDFGGGGGDFGGGDF